MTRRVVRLVERRTREVALARADADFLRATARHVVEVLPGDRAGRYRLTPRGHVGFVDGPTRRFEIRPKFPWPALRMLLGLREAEPAGGVVEPDGGLLAVFARALAEELRAVVRAGLIGGYHEEERESPFLRGRVRTADQIRDAAARAFPDHFHVTESVFDLDTPWHRIPRAVAASLLARPDLVADVRADLAAAIAPLESVPVQPLTEEDDGMAAREPRAAGYNDLLVLCSRIHGGLVAADPLGRDSGAFLIDLGRAFEQYLGTNLAHAVGVRPGWSVEAQPRFVLGHLKGEPIEVQPDLVVRRGGRVRAVLDAKWKRPGPDPADLQQILAYATVTGAARVGLVYPGSRFARHDLRLKGGRLRVSLFRVQVVGATADCVQSLERLAGWIH